MPGKRRPESYEAERRYKAGDKLVDIARSLGVPEGTVRRWKSTQNWDDNQSSESKKKQTERSDSKTRTKPNAKPNVRNKKKVLSSAALADKQVAEALEDNDVLTPQQKEFCRIFMRIGNATQAYFQSHGGTYATANTEGPASLVNPRIRAELRRLRKIKNEALGYFDGTDIVDLHWRIAFADLTHFVEFRKVRRPILKDGKPIPIEDAQTGETKHLAQDVNEVFFKDSAAVDGQVLAEVSQGRDGARLKLADRQRSLQFLEKYFELHPMDAHRKEFDRKRYDLELLKQEAANQANAGEDGGPSSNFMEALKATVEEVWVNHDSTEDTK